MMHRIQGDDCSKFLSARKASDHRNPSVNPLKILIVETECHVNFLS